MLPCLRCLRRTTPRSKHVTLLTLQAVLSSSQAGEQAASKARSLAERHQEAVARLTGENLVLMLKLRQSEAAALSVAAQRDTLSRQLEQQKAPWFDQVSPDVITARVTKPAAHEYCMNCPTTSHAGA